MNRTMKLILAVAGAILIAVAIGWIWGASGRIAVEKQLEDVQFRFEVAEARALILQARVDLYNVNFGDASRHLEAAKVPLQGALSRLETMGSDEMAKKAKEALAKVDEAQRLAGKLDQGANTAAAAAVRALDELGGRREL